MTYSKSKRAATLFLAIVMLFTLFPQIAPTAYADTALTGLTNENIGLQYTTSTFYDPSWSAGGTTINGSVHGEGTLVKTAGDTTLTITNKYSIPAKLSFTYTVEYTGNNGNGSVSVNGAGGSSGTISNYELSAGATYKIKITSPEGSGNYTKIAISNIILIPEKQVNVIFIPSENGSYTINGSHVSSSGYTYSGSASDANFSLVPTAADGYMFSCWYDDTNKKYLSRDATTTLSVGDDCTITAKFVKKDAALFQVGKVAGNSFYDLGDAIYCAENSKNNADKQITLANNGTLYGNYTIPAGITLLIPFDSAYTCYTTEPGCIDAVLNAGTYQSPSVYRKLTMASGSSITVNGEISVSAKHTSQANGQNHPGGGAISGPYGYIYMNDGSNIILNSGAKLYCWGYISGDGMVEAKNGSTVYEYFQIRDFRGGNATSSIQSDGNGKQAFFFSQYYIQNIEAPLKINFGAKELLYTSIWASRMPNSTSATFLGDGGLFRINDSDGYVIKKYDPKADKLKVDVYGDVSISSITVKIFISINSGDYVLPINNSIDITVKEGGNATISESLAFLPGSSLTIEKGAVLNIADGESVFFYDRDEWMGKQYVYLNSNHTPVYYSPISGRYKRTDNDLKDAMLKINGTVISYGTAESGIYTTVSGANVCSDTEGASIQFVNGSGSKTSTYQVKQNDTAVTLDPINITSAKLKNKDGTDFLTQGTGAGVTYYYIDGKWGEAKRDVTVIFKLNDLEGGQSSADKTQTIKAETETALDKNTWTRTDYEFVGWATNPDGSGDSYADGGTINTNQDETVLYAQWKRTHYYLTFEAGANGSMTGTENVVRVAADTPKDKVTVPEYTANEGFVFDKLVWEKDEASTVVTNDQTVTVMFKVQTFTVTIDGATQTVEYGQSLPELNKVTKNSDGSYTVIMSVAAGEGCTVTRTANGYLISDVKGNISINTEKIHVNIWLCDSEQYVANPTGKNLVVLRQLDSTATAPEARPAYAVGSDKLYWSDAYDAYVDFADAKLSAEQILNRLVSAVGTPTAVNYDGDVTGDGRVTSVDAGIINDILHGRQNPGITDLMRLRMDVAAAQGATLPFDGLTGADVKVSTADIRAILNIATVNNSGT